MSVSVATRIVSEPAARGGVPLFVHDDWRERFPWAFAATTGAGDDASFDLGLFGDTPVGTTMARWRALMAETGFTAAVHSRQVHGNLVQLHHDSPDGLLVTEGFDGHATAMPGILLAVSVADCVPVFLLDPEARAVALLHAGWRGVAADVLEAGLAALAELAGTRPENVWLHAGPAICERCYEVGPEVHEALGLARPRTGSTIDLRGALARRARQSGIATERVTISAHCTKCGPGRFFSHRGGERGRQMAVLGILA